MLSLFLAETDFMLTHLPLFCRCLFVVTNYNYKKPFSMAKTTTFTQPLFLLLMMRYYVRWYTNMHQNTGYCSKLIREGIWMYSYSLSSRFCAILDVSVWIFFHHLQPWINFYLNFLILLNIISMSWTMI